jgi:hypothetical protein
LRTGNDLRDQADLAPTRLVTTGSWFSDCIGASGSLIIVGSWGSSSTKSKLSPLTERLATPALSIQMQEGQVMSSSTTTKVFINIEKAKDEALDFTTSLRHWRLEVFTCLIAIENLWAYHSLTNNHPWLSKAFDAYSTISIISSIISFPSYQFLSSTPKLLSPSFPESRGEIPSRGDSLSHPKISILECQPFY